jgi:hypothetical protein
LPRLYSTKFLPSYRLSSQFNINLGVSFGKKILTKCKFVFSLVKRMRQHMANKEKSIIARKKHHQAKPTIRTNHLLIIGIDEYSNGIAPLNNAVRDAQNYRDLIFHQYQFSKENTTCLFNKEANRANIIRVFSELLNRLGENDNLVFYYSGHGELGQIGNGKRGYWIPSDANLNQVWTYIPNDEINLLFKNSRAHHVFGIVDSCYAGALFLTRKTSAATERINSFPSRWLLTAGRLEPVLDGALGKNSPFATSLLTYLKNNPTDDLWVTDLCSQVLKGMDYNTNKQTPRGEPLQNGGHYGGQFVFYKKGVQPELIGPKNDQITPESIEKNIHTNIIETDNSHHLKQASQPDSQIDSLAKLQQYLKTIASDDLEKALKTYQAYLRPDSSKINDLILQLGRFNRNKKNQLNYVISNEQANRTLAQIRYALLAYIDDLEAEDVLL